MHASYASSQALSYAAMLCDHVFVDDAIADPDDETLVHQCMCSPGRACPLTGAQKACPWRGRLLPPEGQRDMWLQRRQRGRLAVGLPLLLS